jgi:hypothetical protein
MSNKLGRSAQWTMEIDSNEKSQPIAIEKKSKF